MGIYLNGPLDLEVDGNFLTVDGDQFSLEESDTVGTEGGRRYEALFVYADTNNDTGKSFTIHVLASEDQSHCVSLWEPTVEFGNVKIINNALTAECGQTGDDDDELDD